SNPYHILLSWEIAKSDRQYLPPKLKILLINVLNPTNSWNKSLQPLVLLFPVAAFKRILAVAR
ncbi:MAG: hypothetical protein ABRQ27_07690, partial [Clostridiaceae bacterium]